MLVCLDSDILFIIRPPMTQCEGWWWQSNLSPWIRRILKLVIFLCNLWTNPERIHNWGCERINDSWWHFVDLDVFSFSFFLYFTRRMQICKEANILPLLLLWWKEEKQEQREESGLDGINKFWFIAFFLLWKWRACVHFSIILEDHISRAALPNGNSMWPSEWVILPNRIPPTDSNGGTIGNEMAKEFFQRI